MAGDDLGEGRFAGTVRAHDGMHFAGTDIEVETLEDLGISNRGRQILHVQHQPTLPSKLTLSKR